MLLLKLQLLHLQRLLLNNFGLKKSFCRILNHKKDFSRYVGSLFFCIWMELFGEIAEAGNRLTDARCHLSDALSFLEEVINLLSDAI